MKTLFELLSRSWRKMKLLRKNEEFEIVDFDHQPYIECYLNDDQPPK